MALNKQKGNMYGFITHTKNYIKGKCPIACEYCYMKQWKNLRDPRIDIIELKEDMGEGKYIFVGSSIDMWHKNILDDWKIQSLEHMNKYPGNKYLLQSKAPHEFIWWIDNYYNLLKPLDIIFATTIESDIDHGISNAVSPWVRAEAMKFLKSRGYKTMVTVEPVLKFDLNIFALLLLYANADYYNIGADSKNHNLKEPTAEEIYSLIEAIPFHQKNNLKRLLK